jgi:hypothetical protein
MNRIAAVGHQQQEGGPLPALALHAIHGTRGGHSGRGILSTRVGYDIRIWEEISSVVHRETYRLVGDTQKVISNDRSLAEFQSKPPVPWQLTEIMAQRAEVWVQRLYDVCCDAYKDRGKVPSADFDRAVWAYCIEPFIMGDRPLRSRDYTVSPLLELLFCAVGSPPEKRRDLRVSQKDSCLHVRRQVYEIWYDKLHHLAPRINEAVAVMARANELEARAMRIARGLPPDPPAQPPTADQAGSMVQRAPSAEPQSTPEASSAALPASPASPPVKEETVIEPRDLTEGETPSQSSGVQEATWDTIEILFLSDERVQIRNGPNTETCNYAEFGFEDGRNGKPSQGWGILRELAEQGGVIREAKQGPQAWAKIEKRVQEIRKVLRTYFGISADPLPYVEGGYRACFNIGCGPSYDT